MRNLLIIVILAALAWTGYSSYQSHSVAGIDDQQLHQADNYEKSESAAFNCDGRVYCSQMTSCAEATYFLHHCPGVKMDGGGDGVPCESQWCGDR
jgi:hypothetical protein